MSKPSYYLTFVHAPNGSYERACFWKTLSSLRNNPNEPWLIIGDFNALVDDNEKCGGAPIRAENSEPFKEFIFNNELMDMGFTGQRNTWTNFQLGEDNIKERLDRGLCTVEWRNRFEKAILYHEPMIGSDHSPLRMEPRGERRMAQTPFRFDMRWTEYPKCDGIILNNWNGEGSCNSKLVNLQSRLKQWSKKEVGNKKIQIKNLQLDLDKLMELPRDEKVKLREKIILGRLKDCWKQEEEFWSQRARVKWLSEGDWNTRFFHLSTIQRKQRNSIWRLKVDEDTWVENESEIKEHICTFFRDLFHRRESGVPEGFERDIPKVITPQINDDLIRPIGDEEIRVAAFDMRPNKSPGPDGFSGKFYRRYWNIIGPQVCHEIKRFFMEVRMPEGWNDTHIVIIPKIPNPEEISQFRPISCCNFIYKIISKVMTNRLRKWIPQIVSDMQTAFTGGRAIQDNVMIVHEVIHFFKTRAGKFKWDMMLKLDMKKAYDMVDWNGLDAILKAMGFDQVWCAWVRECIQTVRSSVLVNGSPTEFFRPSRGIRQGDPLSPFLFILLTNTLSFLIEKGVRNGELKGIQLNRRCPTLTHVLFADDTILFGEASVKEATNIVKTMNTYANITGQTINTNKSAIMFSKHTPEELKNFIRAKLGFQHSPSFGNYLGVPTEWGRSKKEVLGFLL
ncbi:Transposon TX1 uncharacterized 149 kDa protein [Linum perenne]